MTETGLIIGQAVFLLLLYLFIAFVVRASTRALKSSELEMTPPKQPEPPAPAPMPSAPAAPTEVVGAAGATGGGACGGSGCFGGVISSSDDFSARVDARTTKAMNR